MPPACILCRVPEVPIIFVCAAQSILVPQTQLLYSCSNTCSASTVFHWRMQGVLSCACFVSGAGMLSLMHCVYFAWAHLTLLFVNQFTMTFGPTQLLCILLPMLVMLCRLMSSTARVPKWCSSVVSIRQPFRQDTVCIPPFLSWLLELQVEGCMSTGEFQRDGQQFPFSM